MEEIKNVEIALQKISEMLSSYKEKFELQQNEQKTFMSTLDNQFQMLRKFASESIPTRNDDFQVMNYQYIIKVLIRLRVIDIEDDNTRHSIKAFATSYPSIYEKYGRQLLQDKSYYYFRNQVLQDRATHQITKTFFQDYNRFYPEMIYIYRKLFQYNQGQAYESVSNSRCYVYRQIDKTNQGFVDSNSIEHNLSKIYQSLLNQNNIMMLSAVNIAENIGENLNFTKYFVYFLRIFVVILEFQGMPISKHLGHYFEAGPIDVREIRIHFQEVFVQFFPISKAYVKQFKSELQGVSGVKGASRKASIISSSKQYKVINGHFTLQYSEVIF